MGCASSKQQKKCRHCQNRPYTPVTRSYSMHVHHPPQSENDTYHLVALTSSTLGSLAGAAAFKDSDTAETKKKSSPEELAVGLVEAKTWSAMIDRKIPKIAPMTPVRTPPGEPETINAWELMEGLEDTSPFRSPIHLRSFSFDVVRDPNPESSPPDPPKSRFQEKLPDSPPPKPPMWKKEKVVLYFTSLRGVRKTYEECCHVRAALKALGVRVDERDVSMHAGFRDELRRLGGGGGLPRVFVGEKSIGGAEEIRRLIEDGQLEKVLENCERGCDSGELSSGVCEACGDVRFVPCETCSGSCKVYYESEEEEEEEEEKEESSEDDYGFQRCPDCNENGLIRCPICCC